MRTSKAARESKIAAEEAAKSRALALSQARRAAGNEPDKLADKLADMLMVTDTIQLIYYEMIFLRFLFYYF